MTAQRLADLVRDVPDFPKPGIVFKDITPLLASPAGFAAAVEAMRRLAPPEVDQVVGLEARGFLFAAPVALTLGAGFVPVRKHGKLTGPTVQRSYALEYGTETLAVHADGIRPGARVLLVDDVLATGGTLAAAAHLVSQLGGDLVGVIVLLELAQLKGREFLRSRGVPEVNCVLGPRDT